jgi:DNA invertase Pin-like site-specific DNA recombinase
MTKGDPEPAPIFAAAYVRVSAKEQQCSAKRQMDLVRNFAKRRGLIIVGEYLDVGVTGVKRKRKGPDVE